MADLQHDIWLLALRNCLHVSPITSNIDRILDLGCGTGVWALAVATKYPNATILATDLSPPLSNTGSTLENVIFVKSDLENASDWRHLPLESFGFIHGRMLTSGIHDWPNLLKRCWEHLEPGGWLELSDVCHPFRADDPDADDPEKSDFIKWGYMAERCWATNGLDYRATTKHINRMADLGFETVHEKEVRWPLGGWAEDEREKEIGKMALINFTAFLDMAGVGILSQDPDILQQDAEALVDGATRDLLETCCQKRFYLTM